MTGSDGITRRGLFKGVVAGAAASTLSPALLRGESKTARVVRVESGKLWRDGRRDPEVLAEMVRRGMVALTGAQTPTDAWRRFVTAEMRVGLKINLLGRPHLVTAREVTEAVAAAVINAGVPPGNVIVWDRYAAHFNTTDYELGTGRLGERVEAGGEYDDARGLTGSRGRAPIDTMVTAKTDVTINLPVLKDHGNAGVTLALKNIAFGCFKHYGNAHDGNCSPFIQEAYQQFTRVARAPLIVVDATRACFDGGPRPSDRNRIWNENALFFATDPVAMDVVGRRLIAARRTASGLSDPTRAAIHIEAARRMGLGVGDPANIEEVSLAV